MDVPRTFIASRQALRLRKRAHHTEAGAAADPDIRRFVLKAVDRARGAAWPRLDFAPFATAMTFGGLKQVADLYHEACVKRGMAPGRLMCSYFSGEVGTLPQLQWLTTDRPNSEVMPCA